jgi:hypothetical protein
MVCCLRGDRYPSNIHPSKLRDILLAENIKGTDYELNALGLEEKRKPECESFPRSSCRNAHDVPVAPENGAISTAYIQDA